MSYETFYLRAPTKEDAIADIKGALERAGVDPYRDVFTDLDGEDVFNASTVVVIEANAWYKSPPTWDGDKYSGGERGDHCLITGRTNNPILKSLISQFAPSDPKLDPSEVPAENKEANGTSRINPPATPIRPIATVE